MRGDKKMKATVKISLTPKELGVLKNALNNYTNKLDTLESKELGYEMDRKIAKERRMIQQLNKDLGANEE